MNVLYINTIKVSIMFRYSLIQLKYPTLKHWLLKETYFLAKINAKTFYANNELPKY